MKTAVVVMAREALKVAAAVPVVREREVAGEQISGGSENGASKG